MIGFICVIILLTSNIALLISSIIYDKRIEKIFKEQVEIIMQGYRESVGKENGKNDLL